MSGDSDDAAGVTALAMAMPDAAAAISFLMNNSPEMPQTVGSDTHDAFLAGKDAAIGTVLAALRAEHRSGLKHLSAEDMLAIGEILLGVDVALSAKVGVDTHGLALEQR